MYSYNEELWHNETIFCGWLYICTYKQNLSLRVFELLSSSLLLNNNKDEDNSPKTLNDKNHQASSQKFKQQTLEESRRTYQPKRIRNNNKDEDNSPKNFNDKNQQALSQKFRQLTNKIWY